MPLFSYKKQKVVPVVAPTAPPVQNIYSAYDHLAPSPPPPPFMENDGRSYSKNLQRQPRGHNDIEKYNHHKFLLNEAEKMNRGKLTYSRIFCCCCFPCLPMWTRTICCFIFLGICGFIGIIAFFVMMFRKPQIVFNGISPQVSGSLNNSSDTGNLRFQFSVYNGNFFEFDFENIKAVIYYPTPNKTTIGVGEISDLMLGPRAVTNITFPIQMIGEGYNDSAFTFDSDGNMIHNASSINNEEAFTNMVMSSCEPSNTTVSKAYMGQHSEKKEIVVIFDLMPTIKVYGYPIVTLAFTGQSTKMSCEKLNGVIKSNEENGQTFHNKPST